MARSHGLIGRWLNWAERPIRSHKQGTNKRSSGKRVNAKAPQTGLYNSTHAMRPKKKGHGRKRSRWI